MSNLDLARSTRRNALLDALALRIPLEPRRVASRQRSEREATCQWHCGESVDCKLPLAVALTNLTPHLDLSGSSPKDRSSSGISGRLGRHWQGGPRSTRLSRLRSAVAPCGAAARVPGRLAWWRPDSLPFPGTSASNAVPGRRLSPSGCEGSVPASYFILLLSRLGPLDHSSH